MFNQKEKICSKSYAYLNIPTISLKEIFVVTILIYVEYNSFNFQTFVIFCFFNAVLIIAFIMSCCL